MSGYVTDDHIKKIIEAMPPGITYLHVNYEVEGEECTVTGRVYGEYYDFSYTHTIEEQGCRHGQTLLVRDSTTREWKNHENHWRERNQHTR